MKTHALRVPATQVRLPRPHPAVRQTLRQPTVQPKLEIGASNDPAEHEADRAAEHVMRMPEPGAATSPQPGAPSFPGGPPVVHRKCEACAGEDDGKLQRRADGEGAASSAPNSVSQVLRAPGRPLDAASRAFFEPRFGASFANVRIHDGSDAHGAARSISARAFTYGSDIAFARGAYTPDTPAGRGLLAHELAHTLQQSAPVRRRWDPPGTDCAGQPQDRWIRTVTVDQQRPQHVTLHWSDNTDEQFPCSAGKGHCCSETPTSPPACEGARSQVDGSNCTPNTTGTGFAVQNRVLDHSRIPFWTEFVPARGIALHVYTPVDGTALSHGCVRLNEDAARRIFCGSRQYRTHVKVVNPARPDCANANLQTAWLNDFATAAQSTDGEPADVVRNIRETRHEMDSAFGRHRPPSDFTTMTAADIPRCVVRRTTEEDRLTQPNVAHGVTGSDLMAGTPEATIASQFAQAYGAIASETAARTLVRQKGAQLWQTARTAVQGSATRKNDRPLYWARLAISRTIRAATNAWTHPLSAAALATARAALLDILETSSRGIDDASFATAPAGQKKILISGFDPFQLDSEMRRSNPSGAAALDLDGQTLTAGSGANLRTGHVESVVFPVRFADFDQGRVENFFAPFVTGANAVDMIVTISQGGSDFELERFAGRRRTGVDDNLGVAYGSQTSPAIPQHLSSSSEFLETTTSGGLRGAMQGTTAAQCHLSRYVGGIQQQDIVSGGQVTAGSHSFGVCTDTFVTASHAGGAPAKESGALAISQGDQAVEGSGRGYLSNEVYYRALATVVTSAHPGVPMIHLHTPSLDYDLRRARFESLRTAIVQAVRQILSRALPQL